MSKLVEKKKTKTKKKTPPQKKQQQKTANENKFTKSHFHELDMAQGHFLKCGIIGLNSVFLIRDWLSW